MAVTLFQTPAGSREMAASENGAVALYVTCPDLAGAKAIAEALVAARLAGSVNILPGARSIYWWRGRSSGRRRL